MPTKPVLEQEYVYTTDSTGEYRIVRVSLDVTEMDEFVTLKPQENMTLAEVERVLHGFEDDVLKKMQMKLEGPFPARLDYKGDLFKIAVGADRKVKGITPM